MRTIKLFIFPVVLIVMFSFLMILGQESATFYIFPVLYGCFHGTVFGILGFSGMLALVSALPLSSGRTKSIINLSAVGAMLLSLAIFFFADPTKYNYPTFSDALPMTFLCIFLVVCILFALVTFKELPKHAKS